MPLIECPDCGKKLSDAAPSCPECGRPMNQIAEKGGVQTVEQTAKKFKSMQLGGMGLFVVGLYIMFALSDYEDDNYKMTLILGCVLIFSGLGMYMFGRFKAWWHHG